MDKVREQQFAMVAEDEWLQPVEQEIERRHSMYQARLSDIERNGSIVDYANGYRYFGWQYDEYMQGWWFREWLPKAHDVYIFGDFNSWQRTQLRLNKDTNGVWSIFLPDAMYSYRLTHGSLYTVVSKVPTLERSPSSFQQSPTQIYSFSP